MVHEGIKNYQCKICDNKFGSSSHLIRHIKLVHDRIKNIQCEICKITFGLLNDLKRHVKAVHEKIKDYQCDICDMKFGYKYILKRHIKGVHDGVGEIQELKHKKQVHKGSKNSKNSKRIEILEKQALDVSNFVEIKQEVKIEPMDEIIDEGSKNEGEPVEENVHKGSKNVKGSKKLKMMGKQALLVSNFDENQIVGVEQKIKNEIEPEVKIEPMVFVDVNEENFN